ncbi:DUF1918 domain-containing protein (plasmid) [Streptomyces sp. NBC_00289]|uniref:DUF1918 domain-containing protein n=2 Tax=Streptomyces sp. NBC_00289 TaxID=2975703 RepID=UPI002F913E83
MRAQVGEVLRFAGRRVGMAEQRAVVTVVLGSDGQPPYRVQYEDGRQTEIFPGPGCCVETGEAHRVSPRGD